MKRQTTLLQAVIVLGGFLALAFLCNQSGIEIHLALFAAWFLAMAVRSEERRVGKECRSRGSPYH